MRSPRPTLEFNRLGRDITESPEWVEAEERASSAEGVVMVFYSELEGSFIFASCPLEPMVKILNAWLKDNPEIKKRVESALFSDFLHRLTALVKEYQVRMK